MLQTRCVIVVGYAGNQLNGGYMITLVTPQFTQVGNTKTVKIGDIKCSDDMLELVQLYTLAEDGQLADTYVWSQHWLTGDIGWIGDSGDVETEIEFAPGMGFWVQCDIDEGMGDIMSVGQVSTDDVTSELNPGYMITLVGNSSPVEVNLADVYCPEDLVELVQLYTLAEDGQLADTYVWSQHWLTGEIGWIGDSGDIETEVMLPAGQAFWIQCDAEEPGEITFPGVEL